MVTNNSSDQPSQNSHLFTLRLWLEDMGRGQTDWRGKVQHVNNGEVRYFREWLTLETFLTDELHMVESQTSHQDIDGNSQ
jgi:hypothetical protein